MNKSVGRNQQIEGLRAIGLLMILLFHFFYRYFEVYETAEYTAFRYFGNMGVAVFFMVSGFFAFGRDGHRLSKLVLRLFKLWVPYVLSITVTFVVLHIWELEGRTVGLVEYLLNIPFLNGFIGVAHVDGAHWYMINLICFILVTFVLQLTGLHRKEYIYTLWLLLSVLFFGASLVTDGILRKLITLVRMFLGSTYTGALICGIQLRKLAADRKAASPLVWINLLLSVALLLYFQNLETTLVFLIFAVAVYLASQGKLTLLEARPFRFFGQISYSVYLIHQYIGFLIIRQCGLHFGGYRLWMPLLAMAVTCVLGFLLDRISKKLMTPVLRRVSGRQMQ